MQKHNNYKAHAHANANAHAHANAMHMHMQMELFILDNCAFLTTVHSSFFQIKHLPNNALDPININKPIINNLQTPPIHMHKNNC